MAGWEGSQGILEDKSEETGLVQIVEDFKAKPRCWTKCSGYGDH